MAHIEVASPPTRRWRRHAGRSKKSKTRILLFQENVLLQLRLPGVRRQDENREALFLDVVVGTPWASKIASGGCH